MLEEELVAGVCSWKVEDELVGKVSSWEVSSMMGIR